MNAERAGIDELPSPAAWLLERGVQGLGLTKTYALQRAVVREAAECWPQWWNHELFGPPHREAELPVLEETHAALRRLRLLRRQRETLRTTTRGRELLADPEELAETLHEDLGAGGVRGRRVAGHRGRAAAGRPAHQRSADGQGRGRRCSPRAGGPGRRTARGRGRCRGALQPVLWRAEGYGLLRRSPRRR